MDVLQFFTFIILSVIGGMIGHSLKIPVGSIIGAMLAVGLAKTFGTLQLDPTVVLSFSIQVILGLMVGLSFVRLSLHQLRQLGLSLLMITCSVTIMTIGIGFILATSSNLDYSLAILSSAPGGMIEMATIAKALELHAPIVVMLHLVRVLAVMTIFPILLESLYRRQSRKGGSHYEVMGHH